MDPETRAEIEARLLSLKAELEGSGAHKVEPNRTDDGGRRDEDHQPLNEMLQSIASSRNRSRAEVHKQVNAALERLRREPEAFGLCEDCDEPIKPGRLRLLPYATLCVACQGAREAPIQRGRRRHLHDID
ncbi:TraR/DksA C4-type zinc finger protein [Myxococcota bacterium]|nr:TraR/DksA C4-type zinc finger protein [Myxococcota bacterium]MBU1432286.1 TraR/DksA C4-type zinc finger protein [Myxococcota bacterium]MBU1900305.1 TraR/DksA C4-type zinc finger protein [Myxococcota bacterium]